MKLNQKGFTLIEILAVVTILGLLATIAIPTVTRYINKARGTSIDLMLKSTYEATENYMMKYNIIVTGTETIKVKDLVQMGFLEPLVDSAGSSKKNCEDNDGSVVVVTRDADTVGGLANYTYKVTLVCPLSGTKTETFPN